MIVFASKLNFVSSPFFLFSEFLIIEEDESFAKMKKKKLKFLWNKAKLKIFIFFLDKIFKFKSKFSFNLLNLQ